MNEITTPFVDPEEDCVIVRSEVPLAVFSACEEAKICRMTEIFPDTFDEELKVTPGQSHRLMLVVIGQSGEGCSRVLLQLELTA